MIKEKVAVENEVIEGEVVETTSEVAEEAKKVGLFGKFVAGTKKHGKKILIGIGLTTAVGIGYVLGAGSSKKADDESDDYDDDSYEDSTDTRSENGTNF